MLGVLAALGSLGLPVRAEDESDQFLNGLRDQGYYDVAANFLERARTSPHVSNEFKNRIPYEEAVTLVRQAGSLSDTVQAEQQLRAATVKFDEYLKSYPDSLLREQVTMQRGAISMSLAQQKLRQFSQPGADKEALREAARAHYATALATMSQVHQSLAGQLKPLEGKILLEQSQIERRKQLRIEFGNAAWLTCQIYQQLAKTYEPGSREQLAQWTKAAAEYEKLYESDSKGLGLHARLQQGICLQEAGEHKRALACFADLTAGEEGMWKHRQEFLLHLQATRRAMESLIALKRYDVAIQAAAIKVGGDDARLPDWLAIRFFAAQAWKLKADTLTDKKVEREAALDKAARLADAVAGVPGGFQLEARNLLVELGKTTQIKEPDTFAEALNRAQLAQQDWQLVNQEYVIASPERKRAIEPDVADKRRTAIRWCLIAVEKADRDTPTAELNLVFYMLSFLFLDEQNYPAAAVVGEHLAREFPEAWRAKDAARIAMKAWVSEYSAVEGDRQFETARIRSIANYIATQWPNTDDSVEALFLLLTLAVHDQNIDEALGYLEKIPEVSPRRGEAEVRVGVSLWRLYLIELRKPERDRLEPARLAATRDKVENVLAAGVKRLKQKEVDALLVEAVLSLATLYIDTNRPEEALAWLNDENVGSLMLVKAGSKHTQEKAFQTETYKVALRSYIGVLPKHKGDQTRREATMKSAEAMMDLLEKSGAGDPQAAERLTRIYIIMGKDLELQLLGVRNDPSARAALSEAFEQFLARIAQRPGNTYNSLIWVAETFFNLGSAADTGRRPAPPAATAYFGKAAETYKQILAIDGAKPGFVPNAGMKTAVQLRLATSHRRRGEFEQGLNLLAAMLMQQPNNLAAQIEAAQLLQERGMAQEAVYFEKAVFGDFPHPQTKENMVWGWASLATRAATNPKLSGTYFEAMLRSCECRYQMGMKLGAPRQTALLSAAKSTISALYLNQPSLGGPAMKKQYDSLTRAIQRGLNEPETGLKAFERPPMSAELPANK